MHRPILRSASLCLVASAAPLVIALGPRTARGQSTSSDSGSPAAIDAGRKIFHGQGNCAMCHGSNLEGTPIAPTLQAHGWKDAKGGTYEAIVGVITTGVSGTAMVSHPGGISDDDVRKVAAYVWSVSHGKTKP
jgi:ubiquinol-cytochrome c reductase cytochrome c subunit